MRIIGAEALRAIDARGLAELVDRRDCVIAAGDGEISGLAAAALLSADFALLTESATLRIDTPQAWGAVVHRLGRSALKLWFGPVSSVEAAASAASGRAKRPPPHLGQSQSQSLHLTAREALAIGLCDAIGEPSSWLRGRSATALDSAASLIRTRGGDVLERAEFARLFAAGVPQEGLRAFLEKRRPRFGNTL